MASYQHSRVFDSMKQVKEGISSNYTSLQYLQTLDYFLWEAVKPIAIECPDLFYNYLAKITARQTLKTSSKFTSEDRTKMPVQLFNTLTVKDPIKAFEQSRLLYVNRGLMFGFISLFLNKLTYYAELQQGEHKIPSVMRNTLIHRIEQSLGLRSNGMLYQAMLQTTYWDKKARWWKELIIEKYTRMTVLQAQRTYTDFNHFVPLDDVVQTYMM